MKILIVTQYFWPENFKINDVCDALIEKGHDITVLTGLPNYPRGKFFKDYSYLGPYIEQKGKIKIYRIPFILRGPKKGIQLILNYFSFAFLGSIFAFYFSVKFKFDKTLVYAPSPATSVIPAIVLKKLTNIPVVYWVTDLWPETLIATNVISSPRVIKLWHKIINFLYGNCEKILVSSKGFKNKIQAQGIPSHKIEFWPQWVETIFEKKPLSVSTALKSEVPKGFVVMFAGNIGGSQSFETIIEAAKILKKQKEIKWVILGDGLMKRWVEEQISSHGLEETFFLLGSRPMESMPDYYFLADVLLASLTDEPLFAITIPAKIQSYLPSGKPIIASMNGEGAEVIEEAKAGVSCAASDSTSLAKSVQYLYSLEERERELMGQGGVKYYKEHFYRETMLNRLDLLLKEFPKC